MRSFALGAAVALVSALAGCAAPPAAPQGGGGGTVVEMKDVAFAPLELRVPVGTTVTWVNRDPVEHTVTPDNRTLWGTEGSGNAYEQWVKPEGEWGFTFTSPGEYAYHCVPHASPGGPSGAFRGMVGKVIVTG